MTSDSPHLRFAIVGIVTISLFASLFARLWFLQVATAPEYRVAAKNLAVRVVQEEAPRGRILDRQGRVLVDNRRSIQVSIDWQAFDKLEEPEQNALLGRLARALNADATRRAAGQTSNPVPTTAVPAGPGGPSSTTTSTAPSTTTTTIVEGETPPPPEVVSVASLRRRLNDTRFSHFKPVPVATDVTESLEIYLVEHADDFPTVEARRITIRQYHFGMLLAHVLGYVGTVNEGDLADFQNKAKPYELSDEIGKSGIERSMEADLRGQPGVIRYEVDARNRPVRELVGGRAAVPGNDVYLTVDIGLQYLVEKSLAAQIEQVHKHGCTRSGCPQTKSGSAVVTDPSTGQVLAMASYPTYDPSVFTGGISTEDYKALTAKANGEPLLNRAIGGTYAPGSTWKLFSAYAGLANNEITPELVVGDGGVYRLPDCKIGKCEFSNAGRAVHGPVDLSKALTVSSDVYFYRLGDNMWRHRNAIGDDALAKAYETWGFGAKTGSGLAGEVKGALPSPAQKKELAAVLHKGEPPATIADYGTWRSGDNMNTAIGQGGVEVTPLQLVNGYATFANGGTLFQPHLVIQVLRPFSGKVVDVPAPTVVRKIDLPPAWRLPMLDGFNGVTQSDNPLGTAFNTFQGFPFGTFSVGGKTGTAQVTNAANDTSLFAAFAPSGAPRFAAVAILPEAGNGGDAAAPLIRRILEPVADAGGDLTRLPKPPEGGRFDVDQAVDDITAPPSGGID